MSFIMLDRDGVINYDSDEYIKSVDEWIALPGSLEAIAQLNRANYQVFVVTNQSGIGRNFFDLEALSEMHEKLIKELAEVGGYIEGIYFCPHLPSDHCQCRKPKQGLLHEIQQQYPVNFEETYFIGDSLTDMQLAITAGCKPILVLTGKGQKTLAEHPEFSHFPVVADLAAATDFILANKAG